MVEAKRPNWDDLRVFLALLRSGSLRRAADTLGVSRPTAARRLTALEESLGLILFERRPDGLHATAEALELIPAAEQVESAMLAVTRRARAADPELRGPVRVTVPAAVASELLMPDFVEFSRRYPRIDLHISGSYEVASLDGREADVAIRFMPHGTAPDEELIGRPAGVAYVAAYGHGDCWIGQRGPESDRLWVARSPFPDLPIRGAMLDGHMQRAACLAGLGMAMLPCFLAEPHLERRTDPEPGLDIWVLVHPDLRRNPRLRVFREFVVAALKRHRGRLEGRGSAD